MAGSVNKAIILGNLGSDPEEIANGKGCRFSVATNERWTDKRGQTQERTEWHRVTAWGKTAENCVKYLAKGRSVYVEGSIQTNEWEDDDGKIRYSTEIKAFSVTFLSGGTDGGGDRGGRKKKRRSGGGRKKRRNGNGGGGWPTGGGNDQSFYDDDIPF